jgi:hypothetical protein
MILLNLSWFLFIAVEIARNYYVIEVRKSKPVYLQSFIFRGWMAIIHGIMLNVDPVSWWPVLAFQMTSFWLVFDLVLNVLRGKPWYYRGETSGWLDRVPSTIIYWLMKAAAFTYMTGYIINLISKS